jgi:hypothetical protein
VNGAVSHSGIGGLVGWNSGLGTISNSYSSSGVVGNGALSVGGLVGLNGGTVTGSFWDITTSGQATSAGGTGFALTSDAMIQANYTGWDFATTWWMSDTNTRPFLRSEYSTTITNAHQLQLMALNLAGSYTLGANVDATATNGAAASGMWTTAGFVPVGNITTPFTGSLDGQNNSISNLSINTPATGYVGLFGVADTTATIQNIKLANSNVSGSYGVGILAGYNYGAISNSNVAGSVTGGDFGYYIGGLVGISSGTISLSSSSGTITVGNSSNAIGGLVGQVSGFGSVSNSNATGAVTVGTSSNTIGGLVGVVNSSTATVSGSSATGAVTVGGGASNAIGGLIGRNSGVTTTSYASGNVSVTGGTSNNNIGGLIGNQGMTGSVSNSYATGNVNVVGDWSNGIGGLVGGSSGATSNSYALGSMTVGVNINTVGGLVGRNSATGSISNTYSTGLITGSIDTVGGLVGFNNFGTVTSSYWDTATSGMADGLGIGLDGAVPGVPGTPQTGVTGLATAQFFDSANFTGFTFGTVGGTANQWVIVDANGTLNNAAAAAGATRPVLLSEYSTTINNAHQLQLMATNLAGNYTLGANVDASKTAGSMDVWGSSGFVPIGNITTQFTGQFDGLDHAISNLNINWPTGYQGLFGYVGVSGAVSNVGLVNPTINGGVGNTVGGLAGRNDGLLVNSYVNGGSVSGAVNVGGLAGYNLGSINGSHSSGNTVSGTNRVGGLVGYNFAALAAPSGTAPVYAGYINNSYVSGGTVNGGVNTGGLVGMNSGSVSGARTVTVYAGSISNSFVENTTVAGTDAVGGFAGANSLGLVGTGTAPAYIGTINRSYTSGGSVTANGGVNSSVGGFIGNNNGNIADTYSVGGTVISGGTAASRTVGGFVGWNNATGTISNSYSSNGVVAGNALYAGGFAGWNSSTMTAGYWDNVTSGIPVTGIGGGTLTGATGLTTVQMMGAANFTGFDFANTWWAGNGTRPFLRIEYSTTITNSHQLQLMGMNLSANYTLGANIDMAETTTGVGMWSAAGFTPVGVDFATPFTGNFDGQNNTITNLGINRNAGYQGLFGGIGAGSTVSNVGLLNVTISGGTGNDIGALAGSNHGTISNSYLNGGTVSGRNNVGGLVGWNNGTISFSHVDSVSITGNNAVGGMVGYLDGSINNGSYVLKSTVSGVGSGSGGVGGLVGAAFSPAVIDGSYTSGGTVIGTGNHIGGLLGSSESGAINNSYVLGGSVWGINSVGGLLGGGWGSISASYVSGGNVSGSQSIGGLVGDNGSFGLIDNSHVSNVSVNSSSMYAGGLVGRNWGGISNSQANSAVVNGQSSVGGLVGDNLGTITLSYASGGTVWGIGSVGGLVGHNSGDLSYSYASDSGVYGLHEVGGLVGLNSGWAGASGGTGVSSGMAGGNALISYSYVNGGTVQGGNNVGGLVGQNIGGAGGTGATLGPGGAGGAATISNTYASGGIVTGMTNVGGFVGANENGAVGSANVNPGGAGGVASVTNSFWDVDTTGQANAIGFGNLDVVTPVTIATAYTQAAYTGLDFATIWWMSEGNTRPFLQAEWSTSITNAHQLQLVAQDLTNTYTLKNDIDLAAVTTPNGMWVSTKGFVPLGNNTASFTGQLNGAGHVINNLTINRTLEDYVGLFGRANNAAISNVVLANGNVQGRDFVGTLIGESAGGVGNSSITNVSASGIVLGRYYVGGVAGIANSTISNSDSAGTVTGQSTVGGFAGSAAWSTISNSYNASDVTATGIGQTAGGFVGDATWSTISNSYSIGLVSGNSNVGGFAGAMQGGGGNGTISNSYSTGAVTGGGANVGGFVGLKAGSGAVTNSFWDITTSSQATSAAGTGFATTADAMMQANYTGWDFTNTWWMSEGNTRPFLRSEYSTTILNAHQLQLVGMNATTQAASYTLSGNILMPTLVASGMWEIATGFVPIANFTGSFDGQNHAITNLAINRAANNQALFGTVTATGKVANVGLLTPNVVGDAVVGALAGINDGAISNSFVSGGSVKASLSSSAPAGGLVGVNNGTISGSYVTGGTVVIGGTSSGGSLIGGLAGINTGNISNSYVSGGNVTGSSKVGGLAGSNSGVISNSYVSDGTVVGLNTWTGSVGGLVGINSGSISNTYVTGGSVSSAAGDSGWVGGLVGNNLGAVTTSYASAGVISGLWGFGGLVGGNNGGGTVAGSFWDIDSSGNMTGIGDGSAGATGIYSSTPVVNAFTQVTYAGFDFTNTWWMLQGNTRPFLRSEYSTTITNGHQLQMMAMAPAASYTLGNDIVMPALGAGGMWDAAKGFAPVGKETWFPTYGTAFGGTLNGANHSISNLTISRPLESFIGLFGYLANTGFVNNVVLLNANISGAANVGGLVGYNSGGRVSNSFVSNGTINGNDLSWIYAGGLVGYNRGGVIVRSHVSASSVTGTGGGSYVGGLVGYADSGGPTNTIIMSSYVDTGTVVTGSDFVGGLVGYDSGEGTYQGNTVTGIFVNGFGNVGGIAGRINDPWTPPGYFDANHVVNSFVVGTGSHIGGLMGANGTVVNNSSVSGSTVSGTWDVGGLVGLNINTGGNNIGDISNSHVTNTTVSGNSSSGIGGLVGRNDGAVHTSYVSGGSVTGTSSGGSVGGLVGRNTGVIGSSYVTGGTIVSGMYDVGGLVGDNSATGTIADSYVDSAVVSAVGSNIGGLVGRNVGSVTNSHFDVDAVTTNAGNNVTFGGLYGTQYSDWYNLGALTPLAIANYSTSLASLGGGIYGISTLQGMKDMLAFVDDVTPYSFSLTANIDLATLPGFYVPVLAGNFDGGGNTVSNLALTLPNDNMGLFGEVQVTGSVNNLGVLNASVSGNSRVGGLAGINSGGTISNNYVSASTVAGSSAVGGLVGRNFGGLVDNSYVDNGIVSGGMTVGGLVGLDDGDWGPVQVGVVNNSHALNTSVTGNSQVGGLVGFVGGGNPVYDAITYSYVEGGTVTSNAITSGNAIGGLVGYISTNSIVSNYVTNGIVNGGIADSVGGLVGYNDGVIGNNYVSATSVAGRNSVGGLVGLSLGGTGAAGGIGYSPTTGLSGAAGFSVVISNSYVSGSTVSGVNDAGGLVGRNQGGFGGSGGMGYSALGGIGGTGGAATISDSYVNGVTVTATTNAGGLVGANIGGNGGVGGFGYGNNWGPYSAMGGVGGVGGVATISTSYSSAGVVTGTTNVGGLIGNNVSGALGANDPTPIYGGLGGAGGVAGAVSDFWDFDTTGQAAAIGAGNLDAVTQINSATPTINAFNQATYAGLDFTNTWWIAEGNTRPFLKTEWSNNITNAHQLQLMGMDTTTLATSYTLANNIDLAPSLAAGGMWNVANGFMPVGDITTPFIGQFDGQNFNISNLKIGGAVSQVGLFGQVDVGASIGNVGLVDPQVSGSWSVGALVGGNGGAVTNSYVINGIISGTLSSGVGGLVGYNSGIISSSYSSGGSVSGGSFTAGGLVGTNSISGTISQSYADSGSVTGSVGLTGALVGVNNGSIIDSYWNSAIATGLGMNTGTSNAAGLTAAQMQQQSSFAGFDFTNTWRIYNGHTAPLLKSFLTPVTVTASGITGNYTKTYDGAAWSAPALGVITYSDIAATNQLNEATPFGAPVTNAGSYEMFWSGQQGYDISYTAGGMLTINPAVVTLLSLKANDASKTYGTTLNFTGTEFGFTSGALVGGDTISGVTLNSTGAVNTANVGSYAITPSSAVFSVGSASNYSITYVDGVLTVTPATLTYTANAANRLYGGADPVFSGTVSGFVLADNLGNATTGTANWNTSALNTSNVGSYAINGSGLAANNGNYTFVQAPGNATAYSILQRGISIIATATSKVYGSADPNLFTVGGNGLASWDSNSTAFTGSLSHTGGENVVGSPYAITQGTLAANSNYSVTGFTSNNLTITPAALTVAGVPANKVLGTPDPLLTYTTSGLQFSDTEATVLNGGSLMRDPGDTIGSYLVNQGTLALLSTNYTMTYVPCNFTILAPTVVQEITQISMQNTPKDDTATTTTEDEKKQAAQAAAEAEVVADTGGATTEPLPVCQ